MSDEDTKQADENEEQSSADKFELSDDGREKVRQMRAAYDDDRETAVLPGTDGTITGVAVNKWLDEDGNPKFGKDKKDSDEHGSDEHGGDEHGSDEPKQDAD